MPELHGAFLPTTFGVAQGAQSFTNAPIEKAASTSTLDAVLNAENIRAAQVSLFPNLQPETLDIRMM